MRHSPGFPFAAAFIDIGCSMFDVGCWMLLLKGLNLPNGYSIFENA
jgi:hypothetical protein